MISDHTPDKHSFNVLYFSNTRLPVFDSDSMLNDEQIKKYCISYFSIGTVDSIKVALVEKFDSLVLYHYEIKGLLSTSYQGTLLINRNNHHGLFLPVVDARLFKPNHNKLFIYGIQQYRTYGYFNVYSVCNDSIIQVLASENLCRDGLPVRNSSLDCNSYEPANLKLSIKDLNGDGAIDFIFFGVLNSYCQGLESGFGRLDKRPLKITPLNIIFESRPLDNNTGFLWQLSDTSICSTIRK
jgi:hypothetical protein